MGLCVSGLNFICRIAHIFYDRSHFVGTPPMRGLRNIRCCSHPSRTTCHKGAALADTCYSSSTVMHCLAHATVSRYL